MSKPLNYQMSKDETERIMKLILDASKEAPEELLEDGTNQEKIKWIKTILSAIQSSNEQAEDDGFVPIYTGPFKMDVNVDLNEQMKKYTNILVDTLKLVNQVHDKLDEENRKYQDRPLSELVEDPKFKDLSLVTAKTELEKINKKNKMRRINWNGFLKEVEHMMSTFEEVRDSDDESSNESDED